MGVGLYQKLAFWKQSKEQVHVGVFVSKSTLWLTVKNEQAEPVFSSIEFDGDWEQAFESIQQQIPFAQLAIVLDSEFYQLIQADRPNVDASELPSALLWSVKDLVNIPPANIHLDYFDSPISSNGKINVVTMERSLAQQIAIAADNVGLSIKSINIEELMLTKLDAEEHQAQLVLCHHAGGELLLAVVKGGAMYLQRRIRGLHALDKMTREDLSYGAADNLSVEIQRSMDFYEGQLRQAPIKQITLLIDNVGEDLASLLRANFDQKVEALDVGGVSAYLSSLALVQRSDASLEVV